jgi:hypothetical protein
MFLALPTCSEDQVRTSLVFTCPWVKPTDIRSIKVLEAQRKSTLVPLGTGVKVINRVRANDRLRIRQLQHEGISREDSRGIISTRWNRD